MKRRTMLGIGLVVIVLGGLVGYRQFFSVPTAPGVPGSAVEPMAKRPWPPVQRPDLTPSPEVPDQAAILKRQTPPPLILPDTPLPPQSLANRIVIEKKARRLTLFENDRALKTYAIALGRQPEGPKQFEGDNKTPEGRYQIASRKKNSSYHRALRISYPNPNDRAFAASQRRSPGGDIMIHGLPNGWGALGPLHLRRDWTAGCIAVTNEEIEEIWRAAPDGTPIDIRP